MMTLELRPYNPDTDIPCNGWDCIAVKHAQEAGKILYVDQYGDIWTSGQREYIGKIRREAGTI